MLDNAVRICDANGSVGICRWDGDALHHVVHRQARPAFAEVMKRTPIYPDPKTNVGRMLVTKTVVHVPDLAAQPAYTEQREPGIVAAVEIGRRGPLRRYSPSLPTERHSRAPQETPPPAE
jgi:hypothetical protein